MTRGRAYCSVGVATYTALVLLLGAVSCVLAPAQMVVNEVLALNRGVALDGEGNPSDFVELHNPSARAVTLAGHYLTDDRAALTKWRFGAVSIEPRGYLVVWCSGKDRPSSKAPHTSFKLGRKGGEVLLVAADGESIVSAMSYGSQRPDVSQGRQGTARRTTFVGPGVAARWLKPEKALDKGWRDPEFDRSAWAEGVSGLGWGDGHVAPARIKTQLPRDGGSFLYLAFEFTVDDPRRWHHVAFEMASLDGFVAWLNGFELGRVNASTDLKEDPNADLRVPEPRVRTDTFHVADPAKHLRPGRNVLAVRGLLRHGWVRSGFFEPTLSGYVREGLPSDDVVWFDRPTPGGPNGSGDFNTLGRPTLEPAHGWVDGPVEVRIAPPVGAPEGTVLRGTLDGSMPTVDSPLMATTMTITRTTHVRVRAFAPGATPGAVGVGTYIGRQAKELGFSSNLPVIVINTLGTTAHHDGRAFMRVDVFSPGEDGRSRLTGGPSMTGVGTIRTRGSSTRYRMKKQYRLELQDAEGADVAAPLLGLPADSDWVLYGPFNFDRALIRNPLALELGRRVTGEWSPRSRFCEVFVNQGFGRLQSEHYVGLYVLLEKIKRGKHRVSVERQRAGDRLEKNMTGGYVFKIDRLGPGENGFFAGGQKLQYVYPKERSISDPQKRWLKDHIDAFGRALNGKDSADPNKGYARFIDVDGWIRFHFLQEFVRNPDAFKLSTYLNKPRGKKIRMGPLWDFDRAFRTHDDRTWVGYAADPKGWSKDGYYGWWGVLFRDPAFRKRYREIGRGLLANELAVENIHGLVDQLAAEIAEAHERNHRRWPIVPVGEWENDIRALKNWIAARHAWFEAELLEIPFFEWDSGAPPLRLTMSHANPDGEIWFTTDGSDPMLEDGTLSPRARRYGGRPLDVTEPSAVAARVRVGERFSRITDRKFGGATPKLVISEIMYNPPRGRHYEFIEIMNVGDEPADLAGVSVTGAVHFNFTLSAVRVLLPGERLLVGFQPHNLAKRSDATKFVATGPYLGRLSNTKGELTLRDALGREIATFRYDDDWLPATDGKGASLELANPRGDPGDWKKKRGWRASTRGGSPGR